MHPPPWQAPRLDRGTHRVRRSSRNRIDTGSSRETPSFLETPMCRNIKTLHNFEPPATDDEIRASALQFVRKLSGFAALPRPTRRPSTARWTR